MWSEYIDSYGMIVHHDSDGGGGDTAQRMGMFWLAWFMMDLTEPTIKAIDKYPLEPQEAYKKLRLPSGEWVRHPDASKWYGKPGIMSRDNMTTQLCTMAYAGHKAELQQVYNMLKSRAFFFWNTRKIGENDGWKVPDVMSPELFGVFARGLGWNDWVLTAYDYALYMATKIRVAKAKKDPDDVGDDLNLICMLLLAHRKRPTKYSKLAIEYYFKNRPQAGEDFEHLIDEPGPIGAMLRYFRKECGAPPMGEHYRALLTRTMKEVCGG